jgi:hypothetical protein
VGRAAKGVAWVCILSTLLMGCYGGVVIDPTGEQKDEVYSNDILQVTTKDNVEYSFEQPATIVNDTIIGVIRVPATEGLMRKTVAIPLSVVSTVTLDKISVLMTVIAASAVVGLSVWIISSASWGGTPIEDFPVF